MKYGTCSRCPARVIWAITVNGKNQPIDVDQVDNGNIELDGIPGSDATRAVVVKPEAGKKRYRTHWASCPAADEFRKGKSSAPAAPSRPAPARAASAPATLPSPTPAAPPAAAAPAARPAPVPPASLLASPAPRPLSESEEHELRARRAEEYAGVARHQLDLAWRLDRRMGDALPAQRQLFALVASEHAQLARFYAQLAELALPDCQSTLDARAAASEAGRVADHIAGVAAAAADPGKETGAP